MARNTDHLTIANFDNKDSPTGTTFPFSFGNGAHCTIIKPSTTPRAHGMPAKPQDPNARGPQQFSTPTSSHKHIDPKGIVVKNYKTPVNTCRGTRIRQHKKNTSKQVPADVQQIRTTALSRYSSAGRASVSSNNPVAWLSPWWKASQRSGGETNRRACTRNSLRAPNANSRGLITPHNTWSPPWKAATASAPSAPRSAQIVVKSSTVHIRGRPVGTYTWVCKPTSNFHV